MNRTVLTGIAAGLVAAVAATSWLLWQQATEKANRLSKLVAQARSEASLETPDSRDIGELIRRFSEEIKNGELDPVALRRGRAMLLARRDGKEREAWEDLQSVLLAGSPTLEDRWLGAQLTAKLHLSVAGREEHAKQALNFIDQVLRDDLAGTSIERLEVLELGWLVAFRAGECARWVRLCHEITDSGGDSDSAELVATTQVTLARELLLREGISMNRDALRATAASDDEDHASLATFVQSLGDEPPATERIVRAAKARQEPPAELAFAAGYHLLAQSIDAGEATESRDGVEARNWLRAALRSFSRSVPARHAMMTAELAAENVDAARSHAKWLLEHAAGTDSRRAAWSGVAGG